MAQEKRSTLIIGLTVLLGILFQVVLVLVDRVDSPSRAVVEFSQAYFQFDPSMSERLCSQSLGDGDIIDDYLAAAAKEARNRGYSLNFTKSKLYHVQTEYLGEKGEEQAKVLLTAERKSPLRSFFTGESHEVKEVFDLVKEGEKWKVCGQPFALAEY
jgi:hypothetical protein